MTRFLPIIFILLWSSAFITTKPIVDHSDPFAALSFRFLIVAFGFFLFSLYANIKIISLSNNILPSIATGVFDTKKAAEYTAKFGGTEKMISDSLESLESVGGLTAANSKKMR